MSGYTTLLEHGESFGRGAEHAIYRECRTALGIARYPAFAGQVLIADGLKRGGGGSFLFLPFLFRLPALLALALDRSEPDITDRFPLWCWSGAGPLSFNTPLCDSALRSLLSH